MNPFHPDSLLSFVHEGIAYDQVEGSGAVSMVQNVAYMGFVALIRPSVFLDLCPPLPEEFRRPIPTPIGIPFLDLSMNDETPRVRGHEGRNRMHQCMDEAGDVPLPVAFLFRCGSRARHVDADYLRTLASGAWSQRTRERPHPPFIDGPLFDKVLLGGIWLDAADGFSPPNADASYSTAFDLGQ